MEASFNVVGRPAPQGSKNQFGAESSPHVRPWRMDVKLAAQKAEPPDWNREGAFAVTLVFLFNQPKSHFTSKGKPSCNWTKFPLGRNKGDIDKLCRSTLDALTGVMFNDDNQVVSITARRQWGKSAGALIFIKHLKTHD
jgi:Holliday junction resolvase RusA-like endonuclease